MDLSLQSKNFEKTDSPNVPIMHRLCDTRKKSKPITISQQKKSQNTETIFNEDDKESSPLFTRYSHLISPQDYESYLEFRKDIVTS